MRNGVAAVAVFACACGETAGSSTVDARDRADASGEADAIVDAPEVAANRVFVSDHTSLAFGSLANADAFCMAQAAERGYSGTFVAWLSTKATAARTRIAGSRGWVREDGMPVVDTVDDLVAGNILYPIFVHPYGGEPTVATGTRADGTAHEDNCNDFTSDTSDYTSWNALPYAGKGQWTTSNWGWGCGQRLAIYCFEVGKSVAVAPPPVTGRLAFVTAGKFLSGLGIESADALCQREADMASRTGSFAALLATSNQSARSRFGDGMPWVRPDGVPVTTTASRLVVDGWFDAPVNVTLGGAYVTGYAWLGANSFDQFGDETCGNWTVTAQNADVMYVETGRPDTAFLLGEPCATPKPLVCLQR